MIVKTNLDFSSIAYDGNKLANSAHAAYWLACQHTEDCDSALKIQEEQILDAFHRAASMLGFKVELIAAPVKEQAA